MAGNSADWFMTIHKEQTTIAPAALWPTHFSALFSDPWSMVLVVFVFAFSGSARCQWQIQESHTSEALRGIHSVDGSVAWASGNHGTVLRTTDGGSTWQRCATPPGAEKLDFRGIWAWDANTAIVMSSGPSDQSRFYRTTDSGQHWTEQERNPEKDGFWDTFGFQTQDFGMIGDDKTGVLIGDPIRGHFQTQVMTLGYGWFLDEATCASRANEVAFAASNSSIFVFGSRRYIIVTGGRGGPRALLSPLLAYGDSSRGCRAAPLPLATGSDSSGAFSLVFRNRKHGIVVGGDYKKPNEVSGTAAWTTDGGLHWIAATKPPHGYRSAVAWYPESKIWIAAGTNGSDISEDDGKTWRPLDNHNWNALSLPFAVGPEGCIGKLRSGTIKPNGHTHPIEQPKKSRAAFTPPMKITL